MPAPRYTFLCRRAAQAPLAIFCAPYFKEPTIPMAAPRFFIDAPDDAFAKRVVLPAKTAKHAGRSLRLAAGEAVQLFNGSGKLWTGVIGFSAQEAWVDIERCETPAVEPPLRVTLLQSFVSPDKTEWIVEKAVETGVSEICLAPAARSVTRLSGERLEKRVARLKDIAVAAAEQCGRNVVPTIRAFASLEAALQAADAELKLVFSPGADAAARPLGLVPGCLSAAVAIGPEGGFSPEEIALAQTFGWAPQLLGPRVLRTETAGLAAAVWLQTLAGDFPR